MLIIINDDAAYVSWISRHRQAYVVDCERKPKKNHVVWHRATCSIIKPHKRARLTSGAHIKACSADAAELAFWALEQTGGGLVACPACQPDREEPATAEHQVQHALTHLGREILSYVLDLAVMFLDREASRYDASAHGIAAYLGKSSAQIMPAIHRLFEEGYLEQPATNNVSPTSVIYPTARALRTIPAFEAMPEGALAAELESLKLHGATDHACDQASPR